MTARQVKRSLLRVLTLSLVCFGLAAHAAEGLDNYGKFEQPRNGNSFAPAPGIGIERATSIARKHTGGRVLSATPKQRSSGTVYRVRMLVDGQRVVTVTVDHQGRVKKKR